jgi:hypothetical protein
MMIDTLAKQLIFSTVRITNVATVDESMGAVGNMSQSYAEFVETADPDQLLAWQRLRPAVDTIGAVVELVARSFGARSLLFPMIKSPVGNVIAPEDFAAIDDAAIHINPRHPWLDHGELPGLRRYRRHARQHQAPRPRHALLTVARHAHA